MQSGIVPKILKVLAVVGGMGATSCLMAASASGQDTHYWTEQYGTRSTLLSGAVVGSVNDMSTVYYNPGALGYLEKPELLLSANAYQIRRLKLEDGAGEGIDLDTTDFNPIPNLLAGSFRFNFYGPNRLAYSVLTRHRFDAKLRASRVSVVDGAGGTGEEVLAGGTVQSVRVKDVWVGLTWARELRKRLGFGVTTFLSIRNQQRQDEFIVQAQTSAGDVAMLLGLDNYDADMYSLLWKAGFGLDFRPITLGITVTTPNIRLAGSGWANANETTIGVDLDGDGAADDMFATDLQKDVKSNFESPWSIGVGAAWHLEKSKVHFSAEWFGEVDAYEVLELAPLVSLTTGETIARSLRHSLDSVVNFAAGYEREFGATYSGYLGFNTDLSAYDPASDVATTSYDIFHVAAGGKLNLQKVRFMLGARYAWGSQMATRRIALNPEESHVALSNDADVALEFKQLTFLFGFSLDI